MLCPATALRPAAQQLREMRRPICELERPKTVPCPCPGPTGRIASSSAIVVTLRYRRLPPEVWSVFERRTVSLPVPSAIRSTRGLRLRSVSAASPAWPSPGRCRRARAAQPPARTPFVPFGMAAGASPGGGTAEHPVETGHRPSHAGRRGILEIGVSEGCGVWSCRWERREPEIGAAGSPELQNGPKRHPNLNCALSLFMF